MLPFRLIDRLKFIVERQLVKGAGFQLVVVGVFIGLISLVGGLLVVPQGGEFEEPGSAVWWAFLRLTDPGYLGDDVGTWQRFVSTLLTISGYVVFMGTLVAILTRWLIAKMADLERGLTPVTLKNHVVVLGWTSQTLPLLGELLSSSGRMRRFLEKHDASKLRLVVLSETASAEQVHELQAEPGIGRKARQIILRSGVAIQPEALERVACLDASAVIVPSAAHEAGRLVTSDVGTVKALLTIAARARSLDAPLPFVVAEIQDIRKFPIVERAYPGPLEVVAGDTTISRLMVQNILHPGLSGVYNELFSSGNGNEIYIRSGDSMAGQTLAEVASQRPRAIVMGLLQQTDCGWTVQMPAPTGAVVAEKDRVVMLARDYTETDADPRTPPSTLIERGVCIPKAIESSSSVLRVLLLGWNRRVPGFLDELVSYRRQRFEVDVVSVVPAAERQREIERYLGEQQSVICRHIEADYMVEGELRRVGLFSYDAVLLLSSDRLSSGEEADARTMMGYLQLEGLLNEDERAPQILMELSDPDNRHLLMAYQSEVMISPMIVSHVLAQVALRRELRIVLDELFTVGGAEILFRDPADYPLPASVDFQALQKILGESGEIPLGIHRAKADESGKQLQLNPPRRVYLDLQPEDRLVVLSQTTQ
ncbi:CASTOR/POLLUX-related putative ion channel [Marinobacter sp. F3R08]|uniref:CASTOR/POLLUX-related putative ion channel n=1 Tax=Marinobacter sp. F3R08 TaxID=2841559 RepID=UPI001C0879DC|nr:ion channel DMI1 [Marinobacter sp. F3R08]MBU2953319.1 ion channel DMI1 [Marinobacter sp. F3R08]